ncbi:MAG: glycosyltransferase family 4 protein [Candidatus Aenigmarchaeota archaeon]|nr:glycosyltransferase family 4 protein [Candidatus Aenigmarchaeota archaeon]
MKILIITHGDEYNPKAFCGRWHSLPPLFRKAGHEVRHILKKDWKKFYFKYLKFKPDIVICVGVIGAAVCFMKKLNLINVPIVNGCTDNWTEVMGRTHGIDRIAFLEHYAIKNSDFITTPSRAMEKKCELFGKKVFYIPHGIDKVFDNFDDIMPAKLPGKLKVLYVGGATKYKRITSLIESVKGLDCDVYIIGKVDIEIKDCPPNLHFVGQVDHKNIPQYLKAADILVLTPNDDSTLKMFEYIRAGKCILAVKGRVGYFLDHMENAYLTYDLREGLEKLIKDENLRERLAKNMRKIKIRSWEDVAKEYLEFLENVVLKDKKQ